MKFLESIFVKNKKIENLYYHQLRIQKTQKEHNLVDFFYPEKTNKNLKNKNWCFELENILHDFIDSFFEKNLFLENQVYKLRLLYEKEIDFLEIVPYFPKKIEKLAFVNINNYDYTHKFADRAVINTFLSEKQIQKQELEDIKIDEVILVKNNQLTDTSYSNILWTNNLLDWHTTPFPLLEGTFRAKLLAENKIFLKEITLDNYKDFSHFRLINALLQDQAPAIEIACIV